jgi:cell division transport system permease protein
MPVSSGYVVRETGVNLKRNLVMTLAAILTMAVSLSALAGALIWRQAVNKRAIQWRGGVELSIFLKPNVSASETAAIAQQLKQDIRVKKVRYVNKPEAYQEFKVMFASTPDLVHSLSVADMPPSFRVVPTKAQQVEQIGQQYAGAPGVKDVVYAKQVINSLLNTFHKLQRVAVIIAVLVMVGAIALIVNTIQLAIFARRREVAVMKLVGATNWFIRVPYMLEGLVHGIVGAVVAFALSYGFRNEIASFVGTNSPLLGTSPLYVSSRDGLLTGIIILIVGAGVGVFGSAFAVRRFLAV